MDDFVSQLIDQYLVEATSRLAAMKAAVERGDAPALADSRHTV